MTEFILADTNELLIQSQWLALVMAIVVGAVLSFIFIALSPKVRVTAILGSTVLTTGATAYLGSWNAQVGPSVGTYWICGLMTGILFGFSFHIASHMATALPIPRGHKMRMAGIAFRRLFWMKQSDAEVALKSDLSALLEGLGAEAAQGKKADRQAVLKAVESIHDIIHLARDELASLEALLSQSGEAADLNVQEKINKALTGLLEKIVEIFTHLIRQEDPKLWCALRRIDNSSQTGEYRTIIRVGEMSADRSASSLAIPEDKGLAKALRDQVRKSQPIMNIDREKKPPFWLVGPNDQLGEDLSILVAPVFFHTQGQRHMTFILFICSPQSKIFSLAKHGSFMKCCSDILSMFVCAATAATAGKEHQVGETRKSA